MSDDGHCGAETADGQPCQNPAGSGGRCWIPSHAADAADDVENPQGREFSISEDDHRDLLNAAMTGKSKRGCARAAGVGKDALDRYLEARPEFRDGFERARAHGESELIEGGLRDEDVDTSMAKFLLASSYGYKKAEKREVEGSMEHTGEGGGPMEVTVRRERYDPDG